MAAVCPICLHEPKLLAPHSEIDALMVNCEDCGKLQIDGLLLPELTDRLSRDLRLRPRLRHWLRKRSDRTQKLVLEREMLEKIFSQPPPAPREMADNLIRVLGDTLVERSLGRSERHDLADLVPVIGAFDENSAGFVISELCKEGLIFPKELTAGDPMLLSFRGWDRYYELQRSHSEGPIAFMAMPFNDPLLDRVFESCFKPAANRAGFLLRRIIDNQGAGLIDNQLRVEIRKARFLISELSGNNAGAYWEAGFAEGLGKQVIYTCEKSLFEDKHNRGSRPHFDTNHCVTVPWEEANLDSAAHRLTATIRETLPNEASMSDASG